MGIHVIGPQDWETVIALNDMLRHVPEEGTFKLGGRHFEAQGQFKRFDKAGVPTVEWTTNLTTAKGWVRNGAAVLGRDRYHSRGEDIVLVSHTADITDAWESKSVWTKFVPSQAEWRFHIVNGQSISRDLKVFNRPGQGRGSLASIRARAWDWSARHDVEPPAEARRAAVAAVDALEGYTHGAVDLLIDMEFRPVVLEVNRCPGMDAYTRERWCNAIRKFVRSHGRGNASAETAAARPPVPAWVHRPSTVMARTETGRISSRSREEFYEGVEVV
jgi:hypothetical protein